VKRTHWGQHGDACFGCKARTVSVSAEATPGRRPEAVFHANREREWARDHAATRTLAKQGITPAHVDGSADLAARATDRTEIEAGRLWTK
jgi:hypothetical protein